MPSRRRPSERSNRHPRSAPTYGQLEPRTLLAGFSWLPPGIQSVASHLASQLSSPPTFVQSPTVVGSSIVTAKTAKLSVLATDDGGESSLKYFWQAQSIPTNGSVKFSVNGSNSAKNTTLTFGGAGTYQISVRAVDRLGLTTSSLLTIQVNQVASSIAVRSAADKIVNAGSLSSLLGVGTTYSGIVHDQFGRPLVSQPALTWSLVTRPAGSSPQLTASSNQANLQFNRVGDYLLRATASGVSHQFTVRVGPVLSRLAVSQLDGAAVNSGVTQAVANTSTSLRLQGFDQFNQPMAKVDGLRWSVLNRPSGGNLTVVSGNGAVNFAFTRSGNYAVRGVSSAGTFDLQFAVTQVLSGIRVHAGSRQFSHGSASAWSGSQADFAATAVDQFGVPLTVQPAFAWTLTGQPLGSYPTSNFEANHAQISFERIGSYSLRVGSGAVLNQFQLNVIPTLTSLTATQVDGTALASAETTRVSTSAHTLRLQGYDQFGQALAQLPKLTWTPLLTPTGGRVAVAQSNDQATFKFNRAGDYRIRASGSSELLLFNFDVQSVFTRLELQSNTGKPIASGGRINSLGAPTSFTARAVDQFGQPLTVQPGVTWTAAQTPIGSSPTLQASGNSLTVSFERAGSYTFVANSGNIQTAVSVEIAQRQLSLELSPGSATLETGASLDFSARLLDQFGDPMVKQPYFGWSATGGKISTSGGFTAGTTPGTYSITARSGNWSRSTSITVIASTAVDGFANADISGLVRSAYADGTISRGEMISILRSAGDGGSVTASELADLRFLLAPSSLYNMPDHVRNLAGDVVNGNQANATYQQQPLGNLAAGSTESQLNKLVDKWFLGTDLPILTGSSLQYRPASGALFVSAPSLNDARQGTLGDCYLIASLGSIAARNPGAIQNMFIDNGDDTFTIRFYGGTYGSFYNSSGLISSGFTSGQGTADYVTVNRQLATFADGRFAYSNYGLSSSSTSVPLWIALAEKGYAQWNQTGLAGRDGSLNFSAIEGGWMSDVNAQVLGYNSTLYYFQNSAAQSLINAVNSGQAVTLGTRSNPGISGLVGGHAYTVTAYSSVSGKFTLHNPWGTSHPAALTWSQLVSGCTAFVTVNPVGSSASSQPAWSLNGLQWLRAGAEQAEISAATGLPSESSTAERSEPACEPAAELRSQVTRSAGLSLAATEAAVEPDFGNWACSAEGPGENWEELDQLFAGLIEQHTLADLLAGK